MTTNEIAMRIEAAMPDYLWAFFIEILDNAEDFQLLAMELKNRDKAKKEQRRIACKWAEEKRRNANA